MPLVVTRGVLTTDTVTGPQVVPHGNSLTPKFILFLSGGSDSGDVNTIARILFGAGVSSTKQFAMTAASSQGAVTTGSSSSISSVACIWFIDTDNTSLVKASLTSIDATNFTLNIDSTDGIGRPVHWLAFGGTALVADTFDSIIPLGTGNTSIATTLSDPGFALFGSCGGTGGGGSNFKIDLGMAVSALKQGAIATFSFSGQTDTNTSRWQRTDRCHISVTASEGAQSEYSFDSFSSGFVTVNRISNVADRRLVGLVLGGAKFDVHSFNQALTTGNQSITGVGFRPAFNMFMGVGTAANTATLATMNGNVGYATSSTARDALSWREKDAEVLSAGLTGYAGALCIRHIGGITAAVTLAATDFVSNDANGYTLNNTVVDAISRQILAFSIGDVTPGASHAGTHSTGVKAATMTMAGAGHALSHSAALPGSDTTITGVGHAGSHSAGTQLTTSTKAGASHSQAHSTASNLVGNATDDTVVDSITVPGDIFKTFQDAQARHWTASVIAKAVSISPGNNILQVISDSAPLPVTRRRADGTEIPSTTSIDGTAFVASGTVGVPVLAVEATAIPSSLDVGELGPPRMTNRDLNVILMSASGIAIGTVDNPISVDPAGAASQTVSDGDGSLTVDTAGGALTVAGTAIVASGTITANAGTGPFLTAGVAAHGTPVSGNPVLIGVEARTADPAAVSSGSAVRVYADSVGKGVVLMGSPHSMQADGFVNLTTTTAANVLPVPPLGQRWVVTSILVTNAHPTLGTKVEIRDGTTVRDRGNAGPIDGGWSDDGDVLFIGTVNAAITARCTVSGADVDVCISGYRIAN